MPNVADTSRPQPPWDSLALALQPRGEGLQGMLDALALSTTAMPGVGDVAGLAADGYRFATDPSSRTWGNAGWASLGLIPFVPHAGMLLDAKQLERPRGKLDAMYPAWGMTDFLPGTTPRNVTVYKNPPDEELARLRKRTDLRVVMSKDGKDLYAWPYDEALHPEVADDVFSPSRVKDEKTCIVTNNYRQGIIPRSQP